MFQANGMYVGEKFYSLTPDYDAIEPIRKCTGKGPADIEDVFMHEHGA